MITLISNADVILQVSPAVMDGLQFLGVWILLWQLVRAIVRFEWFHRVVGDMTERKFAVLLVTMWAICSLGPFILIMWVLR